MDPKFLFGFLLALQLLVNVFALEDYFYEFGDKAAAFSRQIYTKEGNIYLFQNNNYVNIPTPLDTRISYVSVTVNAINPPKVDFNEETQTVSIKYSIFEVPVSSYSIYVKGVPTGVSDITTEDS